MDTIPPSDISKSDNQNQGVADDIPTSDQHSPSIVPVILLVLAAPIVVGVFFNLYYFAALFLFHLPPTTALRSILWILAVATTCPLILKMYNEQVALENKYRNPTDGA